MQATVTSPETRLATSRIPSSDCFQAVQQLVRALRELAADRSQVDLARGPMEQAHTERRFEFFYSTRQRRLRQMELGRCGTKAAELGDGDEGAQVGEIEIHAGGQHGSAHLRRCRSRHRSRLHRVSQPLLASFCASQPVSTMVATTRKKWKAVTAGAPMP